MANLIKVMYTADKSKRYFSSNFQNQIQHSVQRGDYKIVWSIVYVKIKRLFFWISNPHRTLRVAKVIINVSHGVTNDCCKCFANR